MKSTLNLKIAIFLVFTSISLVLYSQRSPEKFGKISPENFKMESCPIDSNAHAFFIFDYGNSYFKYADTKVSSTDPQNSRKGFQLFFKRHFRIKIVDTQGFSWANFEIPLYRDGDEEKIVSIKAFTYNLENNKVVKTKLERRDILTEETSEYWSTEKFAMPNVREGSVIEVEYTIKSDFYFNLRTWYFQKSIPVLHSEYHVCIPEYFNYNQTQRGYFPIERKTDSRQTDLTITYQQKASGSSVKEESYTNTYNFREDYYDYTAKEIPAFPVEDYLRTKENYLSKYEFELQYTKFPNALMKLYTTSWEKINENLLLNNSFGRELIKTAHTKSDVEMLNQLGQKDLLLLNSAFSLIKNKLAWNGSENKYVTSSLSKAYNEGSGNCADINLNLVVLLRELGFDAYPVILSTQNHGIIHPAHPSISRFNYVIAMAKLGKDTLLMDATDPYSEINLLPIRCLNDKGWIVKNTGGSWITLMDYKPFSLTESYKMEVNNDFGFKGFNQKVLKDYAAYGYKKEIKKYNNIAEYQEAIEKESKDFKIHEFEVLGLDTIQDNMGISVQFTQHNYLEKSNDITFFKPVYSPFVSKNPFKLEKREYPVEYNYPITVKQIYTIIIPDNFTISELPESITAKTPDGTMRYTYSINQFNDNITITIAFSVSKTLFLPGEYQTLKDFYQLIIDKQNELIVLKTS